MVQMFRVSIHRQGGWCTQSYHTRFISVYVTYASRYCVVVFAVVVVVVIAAGVNTAQKKNKTHRNNIVH